MLRPGSAFCFFAGLIFSVQLAGSPLITKTKINALSFTAIDFPLSVGAGELHRGEKVLSLHVAGKTPIPVISNKNTFICTDRDVLRAARFESNVLAVVRAGKFDVTLITDEWVIYGKIDKAPLSDHVYLKCRGDRGRCDTPNIPLTSTEPMCMTCMDREVLGGYREGTYVESCGERVAGQRTGKKRTGA